MVNVGKANFDSEVIQKSHSAPVLVDFWAPWCGPCRMLGPVLENIEKEQNGQWTLVKVNTDEEQELAGRYGVSGIPHCVLFVDGKPADQFTGALPDHMVREFLGKHVKDEQRKALEDLAARDPIQAARSLLETEARSGPGNSEILWRGALEMLRSGNMDDLRGTLKAIDAPEFVNEKTALLAVLDDEPAANEMALFGQILGSEKESRVVLDQFLKSLEENKGKAQRERLIACFHILGQSHPLVTEYRKKMAQILF